MAKENHSIEEPRAVNCDCLITSQRLLPSVLQQFQKLIVSISKLWVLTYKGRRGLLFVQNLGHLDVWFLIAGNPSYNGFPILKCLRDIFTQIVTIYI